MKKITAITLVFIILFAIPSSVHARIVRPSEIGISTNNFDADLFHEMYYEIIWQNYDNLMNSTPFPWLLRGHEIFRYRDVVARQWSSEMKSLSILMSDELTGETATTERYIEILVNLMMIMEHKLSDVHNHMADADTLKTFMDYTRDVIGIGVSTIDVFLVKNFQIR